MGLTPCNRGDTLPVVESPELGQRRRSISRSGSLQSASPATELARVAWSGPGALRAVAGHLVDGGAEARGGVQGGCRGAQAAEAAVIGSENRLHLLGMTQDAIGNWPGRGNLAAVHRDGARSTVRGSCARSHWANWWGPIDQALRWCWRIHTQLWVLAGVPEAGLGYAVGANGRVAISDGAPNRFEGRVEFVGPMVDAATRTAQVRIEGRGRDAGDPRARDVRAGGDRVNGPDASRGAGVGDRGA